MHDEVPVTRMQSGAARDRWPGLRAFLMLLLGAGIICATALAASGPENKAASASTKAAAPASSNYVGADVCAACHQETVNGFANNPHQRMVLMHGDNGVTCENCHGPGQAHVESGGTTKMFQFASAPAKDVDAKCLGCHAGAHPNFLRSPHAEAGVSCVSCHSIHGGNTQLPGQEAAKKFPAFLATPDATPTGSGKEMLLKAPQPTLCFQCHADVRPNFDMPFHHPVNEGVVQCSDCHDVHGTFGPNNLKSTADQNMICTKCHTDVRGPFVFEHMPVKAEGCLACHSPHGSQNARMLNMPNVNELCIQCHSTVAADTVHGISNASSDSVPCTSCHTYIHGSNMNAAFLR